MDYKLLAFEDAMIDSERLLLLLESRLELEKIGEPFYEEEKKDGLIPKIIQSIKKAIEKLKELLLGKKEIVVTPEEEKKLTNREKILSSLKKNVKNKKLWAALGATVLVGGYAYLKHTPKRLEKKRRIIQMKGDRTSQFNDVVDRLLKEQVNGNITEEEFDKYVSTLRKVLYDDYRVIEKSKGKNPDLGTIKMDDEKIEFSSAKKNGVSGTIKFKKN